MCTACLKQNLKMKKFFILVLVLLSLVVVCVVHKYIYVHITTELMLYAQ